MACVCLKEANGHQGVESFMCQCSRMAMAMRLTNLILGYCTHADAHPLYINGNVIKIQGVSKRTCLNPH